ncbi:Maternal embryonic leucine zipper kinase [Strongyloides ratti]|uniref:Maternal embryonic leucine zipper kinase n=1 Tax=Strongyloides ratti TaxID=34506 RepID=A0A090N030_STRRB|nr:Maternal embryonic leucine zipper kinase [Strongyloides ratti]CEF69970.1 Maternal embryonic leucine zipper kinase [Strongyloides ratti]
MIVKGGGHLYTISPNETEERRRQNNNHIVDRTSLIHSKFSSVHKLVYSVLHTNISKHYSIPSMIKNDNRRPLFIWNNFNNQNNDEKIIELNKKISTEDNKKKCFFRYIKPTFWFKNKNHQLNEELFESNNIYNKKDCSTNIHESDISKFGSFMCLSNELKSTIHTKTSSLPTNINIKCKSNSCMFDHDDKKTDQTFIIEQSLCPKINGYQIIKHIAYGGFSTVYQAKHLLTSVLVAIKHVDIKKMAVENGKNISDTNIPFHEKYKKELKMLKNEKSILQKMNHKHIVKLYHVIESPDLKYFTFVTELCDGLDLFDEILKNGPFNYIDTKYIYSQFIFGLHYLHTHNIAHLDLKPENVIVSKIGHVKIIDFGMALEFTHADTTMASFGDLKIDEIINDSNRHKIKIVSGCGTLKYMGPEILRSEPFNPFQADIWAAGLILYVMIKGSFLFDGTYKNDVLDEIKKKFDVMRAKSHSPHIGKKKEIIDRGYLYHTRYPIITSSVVKIKNQSSKFLYFTQYHDIDYLLVNMLRIHPYRRWNTDQIISKTDFIIKDTTVCHEIEKRKKIRKRSSKTSFCGLVGQLKTNSINDITIEDKIKFDDKRLKQMKALGYCIQSTKESIRKNLYDTPHSIYNLLGVQHQQYFYK